MSLSSYPTQLPTFLVSAHYWKEHHFCLQSPAFETDWFHDVIFFVSDGLNKTANISLMIFIRSNSYETMFVIYIKFLFYTGSQRQEDNLLRPAKKYESSKFLTTHRWLTSQQESSGISRTTLMSGRMDHRQDQYHQLPWHHQCKSASCVLQAHQSKQPLLLQR